MHSGVRAAESTDRANLPAYEGPGAEGNYFSCAVLRPLLHWSLSEVWAIHARYGISPNPMYAMGCERVGCDPCIMSKKREIANTALRRPQRIVFLQEKESLLNANRKRHESYAPFFPLKKVPERYKSQSFTRKDGTQGQAATVADVVAWALNNPDLYTEEFDFFEEAPPACDSRYGACE